MKSDVSCSRHTREVYHRFFPVLALPVAPAWNADVGLSGELCLDSVLSMISCASRILISLWRAALNWPMVHSKV